MFAQQLHIVSGKNVYEYFIIFIISFGVELDLIAGRDRDFVSNEASSLCMNQLYQRETKISKLWELS